MAKYKRSSRDPGKADISGDKASLPGIADFDRWIRKEWNRGKLASPGSLIASSLRGGQ
jgi:hypothetical protein